MAKKRRSKDEEEVDFKAPDFDKEEFIKNQKRNIKITFLAFLFGIVISILSSIIWRSLEENLRWTLVFAFGFFSAAWFRYIIMKLDIDLTDFGRKEWFGSYAIYFFTWLIVLIILVNPPFYDAEQPMAHIALIPGMQELGGTIDIVGYISDNAEIDNINFSITTPTGETLYPDFTFTNHRLNYSYQNNITGEYSVNITITDKSNLRTVYSKSFAYDNNTLKVATKQRNDLGFGDIIRIKADEKISSENFRVYYTLNNGTAINANKTKGFYQTSPYYEGWKPNSNYTMRIYAEVIPNGKYIHARNVSKYSNIVEDTTVYHFSTSDDEEIGTRPPIKTEDLNLPKGYSPAATPGFEVITVVVAFLAAILLIRHKRKKK